MKHFRTLAAAAALAAAASTAFALVGPTPGDDLQTLVPPQQASTLSRDDVRLELHALQQAGLYQPGGEASLDPLAAQRRNERIAELMDTEVQTAMTTDGDTIVVLPDHSMVIIEVVPPDEPNPGEAMPLPPN